MMGASQAVMLGTKLARAFLLCVLAPYLQDPDEDLRRSLFLLPTLYVTIIERLRPHQRRSCRAYKLTQKRGQLGRDHCKATIFMSSGFL